MAKAMNPSRLGCAPDRQAATALGFAYLWLLFVVAFMGVGLSLGAEVYVTSQQRDKEQALLSTGRQFRQAIGRYYETQTASNPATAQRYPASLEDLLKDPRANGVQRHLRQVFVDPMTGKAEWGLYKVAGRVAGVYSLSGKLPIKQDGFEADDAGFRGSERHSDWVFTYPSDLLTKQPAAGGAANSAGLAAPAASLPASSPFASMPLSSLPPASTPLAATPAATLSDGPPTGSSKP